LPVELCDYLLDGLLSCASSRRFANRFERQSATAGPYHQTAKLHVALLAGGSGPSYARSIPEWRSKYFHLMMRRTRKIAKVAMARRLAVRLYWMLRKGWDYEQVKKFGSYAGQPGYRDGVKQTPSN